MRTSVTLGCVVYQYTQEELDSQELGEDGHRCTQLAIL